MAISTDTVVNFFGTQDLLTSTAAIQLGSSAFATTAAVANWTNDDNVPEATIVFKGTFLVAPAAGGSVPLYSRLMAISTAAGDQTIPSTTFKHDLIAVFPVDASTVEQIIAKSVFLPNAEIDQIYQFLPENQASQALSSDYTLNITPKTVGPSTG